LQSSKAAAKLCRKSGCFAICR